MISVETIYNKIQMLPASSQKEVLSKELYRKIYDSAFYRRRN
jgi:hypothetical protein